MTGARGGQGPRYERPGALPAPAARQRHRRHAVRRAPGHGPDQRGREPDPGGQARDLRRGVGPAGQSQRAALLPRRRNDRRLPARRSVDSLFLLQLARLDLFSLLLPMYTSQRRTFR